VVEVFKFSVVELGLDLSLTPDSKGPPHRNTLALLVAAMDWNLGKGAPWIVPEQERSSEDQGSGTSSPLTSCHMFEIEA
jgi:hypothetical protein